MPRPTRIVFSASARIPSRASDWAAVSVGPMTFQASRILSDPTGVSLSDHSMRVDGVRTAVLDVGPKDGRVVLRGKPLPPIPGKRLVEVEGIAVPCGFAWTPPVDAEVVREILGLLPGDLALLEADGTHERIESSAFVPGSRAAARTTLGGLRRG